MLRRAVLTLCLAALGASAAEVTTRPNLSGTARWACFYGRTLSQRTYRSLDMAILDPDAFNPVPVSTGSAKRPLLLGYISFGQAEEHRWYWPLMPNADFLVEKDAHWSGAHMADMRSAKWRGLLLNKIAPHVLAKGYDGFFLDTLDVAEHLESKDPERFKGSMAAAAELVLELRRRFPAALIVINNALPLLPKLGADIDGALAEDVYTLYDLDAKVYRKTDENRTRTMEAALKDYHRRFQRPVYVILYAAPGANGEARPFASRARRNGFFPYLTSVNLDRVGVIEP